jgi:hypothetical protein
MIFDREGPVEATEEHKIPKQAFSFWIFNQSQPKSRSFPS